MSLAGVVSAQDLTIRSGSSIKFLEDSANGSNYLSLKSSTSLAGNVIWTLPTADGSAGQALLTDGAGALYWGSSGGGGGSAALTATYIGYGDGANTLTGEGQFTYNTSSNTLTVQNATITTATILTLNPSNFYLPDTGLDHRLKIDVGVNLTSDRTLTISTPDSNTALTIPVNSLSVAGIDINNSWSDGVKQTFNPSGTNAGLNVGSHTANPSSLANGDIWYNSTDNALRARINGGTVDLGSGSGGSLTATYVGYGSGGGALTGEAAFFYNATTNTLSIDNISATTVNATSLSAATFGIIDSFSDDYLNIVVGEDLSSTRELTINVGDADRTLTISTSLTVAGIDVNNSWGDGVKQTFNPNGTTAGLNVGSHAADPSTLANGDLWYNSTSGDLKARVAGVSIDLGNVEATSAFSNDDRMIRSEGTGRGVSATGITINDDDDISGVNELTVADTTISNSVTVGGSYIDTPSAMGALAVNVNKALNTKTASGDQVITFSGTPVQGQYFSLRWTNTALTEAKISWAVDMYDANTGALVPNFTVPASDGSTHGRRHVVFGYDGSELLIYQGGGSGGVSAWADLTDVPTNLQNLEDATDPGADRIWGWVDGSGDFDFITAGTGITLSGGTITANGTQATGSFTGTGSYSAGIRYSGTMSADAAVTLSLTGGQSTTFELDVTGATRTLSGFTAYRVGYSGGTVTTLDLPVGRHRVHFYHDGTNYILTDSATEAITALNGSWASPDTTATEDIDFTNETYIHVCGANQVLNLPTAVGYTGRGLVVRFDGSYTVTFNPDGTETVDLNGTATSAGEAVIATGTAGQLAIVVSDGTSWAVMGGSASYAEETL